jgi:hypothetical protein
LNDKASESSGRIQPALPGPRPTADAEDALREFERLLQSSDHELERFLQSLDPDRSIPAAEVEPQAPGPVEAMLQAGSRRRVLKAVMLGLTFAAVGAVFALNFTPDLSRWPLAIAPTGAPMAMPSPSDETVAGLSNSGSPLLKNGADLEGAKAAESVGAPASPSGTAPVDDVPPASPAAKSSPSGDALGTSAGRDRTYSIPSGPAPIATPASSAAPQESPSASAAVKAPAGILPETTGGPARVEQRPEPEPSTTQSGTPSGVGEAAKTNPIPLDTAPLPPIRPVSFGMPAKREKAEKPHRIAQAVRAAPEPLAPPPAMPEAPAAQPPGNPLLRLFRDTFK